MSITLFHALVVKPGKMARNEEGQALIEMALVVPVFLLLIGGALWFGPQAYAALAAESISYDCATAASQSLDVLQGVTQGRVAAMQTAQGYRIAPANVSIHIMTPAKWDRGAQVACVAAVKPWGNNQLPLVSALGAPGTQYSRTLMLIAPYKSRWTKR